MRTWGEIEERLDPLFYLNMLLLKRNIVQKSNHRVSTFKQKVNMQRGRFGHRPRNDPRYYGGEYPFIQTGNIVKASESNDKIEYSQTLNELGLSTSRLFDEKVLVITIAANIGYTAILDYSACFPDSLVALTSKENDISLEYLNVYIRFIRNYIENLAPQAAQKNINLKQLSKLPIIVPDKGTQRKIVEIMNKAYTEKIIKEKEAQVLLDSIDDYLLTELGITMLKEEENIVKEHMFYIESSNVLSGRFDPYYYKPKYKAVKEAISNGKYELSKLGNYITNISYGASVENDYVTEGIPLLRIKDITENEIIVDDVVFLPEEFKNKLRTSRVNTNDLLITRSGTIGIVAVVDEKFDNVAFGSFMIKFSVVNIQPMYVSYVLNSSIGKIYFNRNKVGAIQGNITISSIRNIEIPIPCREKQIEIIEHIDKIRLYAKQNQDDAKRILVNAQAKVEMILLGGESI